MPFPPVTFCLVCEGVRQEMGGKLSILGFFGGAPNVDIAVGRFDQPMAISVILGFGPVTDVGAAYDHSVSILNPDRSLLFQSPVARLNIVPGKPGLVVSGGGVTPRVPGVRTIRLMINNQIEFESQFTIRLATPQEVAGMPGARMQ